MPPNGHIYSARDTICQSSGLIQLSFLQVTVDQLQSILRADQNALKDIKRELSLIEEASLYIRSHDKKPSFSCKAKGSAQIIGITKDVERVYKLSRRAYLKHRMGLIETRGRQLQRVIDQSMEAQQMQRFQAKLKRYEDAGLDLCRILFTEEQNEWIDLPLTSNPYHLENVKYPTTNNVLMRSKSEAKLGSMLESIGLPFRPDDLVTIQPGPYGSRPFHDTCFADIKVPNLIGGITVHEHLGAFQLEQYDSNALKRLHDYLTFSVSELPGRPVRREEFTWSFECDLLDQRLLNNLVRRMLLPYPSYT